MDRVPRGCRFHGEFSSADASALSEANSRFSLYAELGVTALTLDANDVVVITDVIINFTGVTARNVQIYDGANNVVGAGELIAQATAAQNEDNHIRLATGHPCQKGTYPKVITSGAGQVDVQVKGYIYRVGA